jgi:hypothetical protein
MSLAALHDPDRVPVDPCDPDRRQLELFDTWTARFLDEITPAHRQVIGTFLRWGLRRRLLRAAATGTLRPWSTRGARMQARIAVEFLSWLDDRSAALNACTQSHLDAWFADGPATRRQSVAFLSWALQHRFCDRRLRLPNFKPTPPNPMPAQQRMALISRLVDDTGLRLDDRVAGLLTTLYAQPASRITRLRVDDVHGHQDGPIALDIAGEPVQLVAPLDQLIDELATGRRGESVWLFPGHTAVLPLHPKTLGARLLRIGVTRAARVGALHDLIREVPGPVLAPLIGYNPNFIADRAATLAVPWANYPSLRRGP